MSSRTLFRPFFTRFLIGVASTGLVFVTLMHLFQVDVVDSEWREELRQEAEWMGRHTSATQSEIMAGAWKQMHSAVRVTFYDEQGVLLADSHPERVAIDLPALHEGEEPPGQLAASAELWGGGTLVMSRPYVPAFPSGLWGELLLAVCLILGPMVLLLYPLIRSIRLALTNMGDIAREVAAGQFGKTMDVQRKDELGQLVESINEMSLKLADAERLNSRLLHDVSHELRSPLGRIQVLADSALQRPAELPQCAHGIEQEVRLLDRLVGDLLQVARLEASGPQSRFESFSLLHWAGEVLSRLELTTQAQNIKWQSELPTQDCELVGDPQHLTQALANLVDNAIHALAGQSDGLIQVRLAFDSEGWTMSVRDNGPGISAQHLEHLFDRFYRVEADRGRDSGGVGLGLSLVLAIAQAHRGSARVESEPGQGTAVIMRIALDGAASSSTG